MDRPAVSQDKVYVRMAERITTKKRSGRKTMEGRRFSRRSLRTLSRWITLVRLLQVAIWMGNGAVPPNHNYRESHHSNNESETVGILDIPD